MFTFELTVLGSFTRSVQKPFFFLFLVIALPNIKQDTIESKLKSLIIKLSAYRLQLIHVKLKKEVFWEVISTFYLQHCWALLPPAAAV